MYRPSNTVVAVAGDLDARRGGLAGVGGVRQGNGTMPGVRARARRCPPARGSSTGRRDTSQAQLSIAVPALRRDHPDAWNLAVLNAVLGDGMSAGCSSAVREEKGLAYDVSSGIVEYADAGALEVSAGVDPGRCRRRSTRSSSSSPGSRDEEVPSDELAKAKAYLSGGLELRMDDTRHLASWIGGQEALHDRVYTLDDALAAVEAVKPPKIRRLAGRAVPRRGAADGGRRARPSTCAAWSATCACRA